MKKNQKQRNSSGTEKPLRRAAAKKQPTQGRQAIAHRVSPPVKKVSAEVETPLEEIVREIQERHSELRIVGRKGFDLSLEIGERLVRLKEMVGHGEWEKCLRDDLGMNPRTARDYMRLYNERKLLPKGSAGFSKSAESADLTLSGAIAILRKKRPAIDPAASRGASGKDAPDARVSGKNKRSPGDDVEMDDDMNDSNGEPSATAQRRSRYEWFCDIYKKLYAVYDDLFDLDTSCSGSEKKSDPRLKKLMDHVDNAREEAKRLKKKGPVLFPESEEELALEDDDSEYDDDSREEPDDENEELEAPKPRGRRRVVVVDDDDDETDSGESEDEEEP